MNTFHKMLFIINPVAGKATLGNHLVEIIDIFVKYGYEVNIRTSQSSNDIAQTILSVGENYDIIVCCGGDGTLNRTADALLRLEKRPKLGYIPAGTVNDFANSHSISRNALEAANAIAKGKDISIDTGCFNGRTFMYIAAFGIFTGVSYLTPQELKNQLGKMAYLVEALKSLTTIDSYHIRFEYDGKVIEDDFIYGMISNSSTVAGIDIALNKDYSFNDGLMEVTLVKEPKNANDRQKLLNALIAQKADSNFLYNFQTKKIKCFSDVPIAWTLDGESGGFHKTATIEVKENSINLKY